MGEKEFRDYRDNLPVFYKVFGLNTDPGNMRDSEIEFLHEYRFGKTELSTEDKKLELFKENPDWLYLRDNEERNFLLTERNKEFCYAMSLWYGQANVEAIEDGIDIYNHQSFPRSIGTGPVGGGYAVLPKERWKKCRDEIGFNKKYDYCFVGAWKVDQPSHKVRQWIYDFDRYTDSSYIKFTDTITKQDYQPLGSFDYTLKTNWGRVQKELSEVTDRELIGEFDENYFRVMCGSKFAFCPAGDAPWSMRMYEALMCKAIPIVMHSKETYRSWEERHLGYKFYYVDEEHVYREDWIEHNYNLFMNYHTYYGS